MDPDRLMKSMMGGFLRGQFPGVAEVEDSYVSPSPEQEEFFDSIEEIDIEDIRRLLKTGKVDIAKRNSDGWTGLHLVCLKGLTDIARLLIAAGAPVDSKTVPFQETPLHLAAGYGHYDIVVMLLEKGASIFAHDSKGQSVLQCTEKRRPWIKEERMEKVRTLLKEKASEAKPLEKVKRREDGCGMCGKKDGALKQCARCKLQWYCSPECQKGDWKLHKPRCSQAKDIWEAIAVLGDTSASNHVRDSAIEKLRAQKDFIRKMKCLKAVLDIVTRDKEIHSGAFNMAHPGLYPLLPSLAALSKLTLNERDVGGRRVIELTEDKELMTQLMDLNGIEIILKRVLKGDLSERMQNEGFRFMASPFGVSPFAPWLARRFLGRGVGPNLVEMLAPAVRTTRVAKAQSAAIIGRLVMEEGNLLQKAGKASTTFGPCTEAMFRTTDLHHLAKAARGDDDVMEGEGAFQGSLTFFAAITRKRNEVLERLIKERRETAFVIVDAYAKALFYPGQGAWAVALEFFARALENVPGFAGGILADVMLAWDPELPEPRDENEIGQTRLGFCYRVTETLDIDLRDQYPEKCEEFRESLGGDVINNWENAALVCYELVQHCPPLREYWDLNCMFGCREHNPNLKVQDIMEKAESIRYLQLKEQVRAEKATRAGSRKKK